MPWASHCAIWPSPVESSTHASHGQFSAACRDRQDGTTGNGCASEMPAVAAVNADNASGSGDLIRALAADTGPSEPQNSAQQQQGCYAYAIDLDLANVYSMQRSRDASGSYTSTGSYWLDLARSSRVYRGLPNYQLGWFRIINLSILSLRRFGAG